jgi:putative methionine-R-sulfoxide reductase with GAF domain
MSSSTRLGSLVAGTGTRTQRAGHLARAVREHGGYRWVGVYEVTDVAVAIMGYAGPGPPRFPRFGQTEGLTGTAVATGRSVLVDDVSADPQYLTAFGSTRSEMIVPVLAPTGGVIGTIDIESDRLAAFREADRELVERCAQAITRLFAVAQR